MGFMVIYARERSRDAYIHLRACVCTRGRQAGNDDWVFLGIAVSDTVQRRGPIREELRLFFFDCSPCPNEGDGDEWRLIFENWRGVARYGFLDGFSIGVL